MCSPSQGAMLPYGLKLPSTCFPFGPTAGLSQVHLSALDFQRSQINDYNVRVQLGLRNYQNSMGFSPFHTYITDPYAQAYFYKHDPRARFVQEEPKPSHSYIGLIGMAILQSKDKKLVLSDIYQWILDNYSYFRTRGPGWRNSIRHNLSLNDCFIKSGRSANGKGHYWAVHPANVDDFERGDFRRRRAQRKVRRHMGLSVPDDDDSPSPSPTPHWTPPDPAITARPPDSNHVSDPLVRGHSSECLPSPQATPIYAPTCRPRKPGKRRLFDVASLLAPDDDDEEEESVNNLDLASKYSKMAEPANVHVSGFTFRPIGKEPIDPNSQCNDSIHSASDQCRPNEFETGDVSRSGVAPEGSGYSPVSATHGVKSNDSDCEEDGDENCEIQVTSGENSPVMDDFNMCESDKEESNKTRSPRNFLKHTDTLQFNRERTTCQERITSNSIHSEGKGYLKDTIQSNMSSPQSPDKNGVKGSPDMTGIGDSSKYDTSKRNDTTPEKLSNGEGDNSYVGNDESKPTVYGDNKDSLISPEMSFKKQLNIRARQLKFGNTPVHKMPNHGLLSPDSKDMFMFSRESLRYLRPGFDLNVPQPIGRVSESGSGTSPGCSPQTSDGRTSTSPPDKRFGESSSSNMASSPVSSESLRQQRPGEALRWAEMSRLMLPRDRMSAFSSLGLQSSVFSQFPQGLPRGFPVLPNRPVLGSVPLRPGGHPLVAPVASSPLILAPASASTATIGATPMVKGMDLLAQQSPPNKTAGTAS